MADLLIRDVPDDVVGQLERRAQRLGLSRAEFLRRQLMVAATDPAEPVSRASLLWLGESVSDLANDEVMDQAWR